MSQQGRDYEKEVMRFCEAMAESVAGMTEDEVLAEAREEGVDATAVADKLRGMARAIGREVRLRPLRAAREQFERDRNVLQERAWPLPASAAERRALLQRALTRRPELEPLLTAAARELKDLPDDDVESMLRDLAALGCLDDLGRE
ncbi:MAG: hypothetical protein ACHQQS_00885 [Thermoanaerobaculales bacterium]